MQFVADLEPNERRRAADHVRHRRPPRPDRVHARRPLRLRGRAPGADRQRRLRPAPERRLRRGARLDPAAHPAQPAAAAAAVADRAGAGGVRDARLARARPGHLGGARRAAALRLLQAHVLGRARPRGQARRDPRRPGAAGDVGARPPTRSAPTSSSTASTTAASCASTTTPTRSTPRRCWRRCSASCPADDPRLRASVLAIADELTEHGFVLRYRTDETDDGLSGKEGTFLICSFWLVSALAIIGELQRARDLMERLLREASPLGLYAEEFDADTGRHLGNFPQAFSHLALIEAAARIILAERLEELTHERLRRDRDRQRRRRRHARAPPRALRQADPAARARRLAAARAAELVGADDVFVDNRYVSPDTWYDADGKPFQPQVHYYVGGATKLYGAALYRLRAEDFGELRHHDGISPAWPISYDEIEPYYTLAEQLYQVHGARGEDPTEPPAQRALPVPGRQPRAAHPAALRRPRGGRPPPVPRALRRHARRARHAVQRAACAARPATASRASCTRSPTPRCSACGRRSSTRTSTLLTERARPCGWRPNAAGTAVTGVVVDRDGEQRDLHRPTSSSSPAARRTARKLLLASATDAHPDGLANGSDQVGRNYMFHNSQAVLALSKEPNPTVFQKTLGLNDFYFGTDDFDYPLGQHPDGRQVVGGDVPRREAAARPAGARADAGRRRPPRRRLLAVHRGPAACRTTA